MRRPISGRDIVAALATSPLAGVNFERMTIKSTVRDIGREGLAYRGVSRNTVRRDSCARAMRYPGGAARHRGAEAEPRAMPYTGRSIRSLCAPPSQRKAIVGYQHPLSVLRRDRNTCRSGESRPTSSSRSWRSATIWPQNCPSRLSPAVSGARRIHLGTSWAPNMPPGRQRCTCPELASHQRRLRPSVARPSCTRRLPGAPLCLAAFFLLEKFWRCVENGTRAAKCQEHASKAPKTLLHLSLAAIYRLPR